MAPPRHTSEISVSDSAALFKPLELPFSGRTVPNRFLKAALSEKLASWRFKDVPARGIPSQELVNLYTHWGAGGWGLILTGNVQIDSVNLEGAGNTIVPENEPFEGPRFEAFKNLATAAKAHGSIFVAQVSHPGRQVEDWLQPNPISASDVQLTASSTGRTYASPRPANKEDIKAVIEKFAHTAEYLEKAGFDGVELHAAHGYLISQFLSPRTNKRTDEYGGSIQNRSRLIFEIAKEIRRRVSPNFILGAKINSVEFQPEGIELEDVKELCVALEEAQFDFIEISGGNYEKAAFTHIKEANRRQENFFLDQAREIRKVLKGKTKVYSTGGFKTVAAMTESLNTLDGVGIGRVACQEPSFPKDALEKNISGAMKQVFDDDDVLKRMAAAFTHIKQLGANETPLDFTVQENVDYFWNATLQHIKLVAADSSHELV